MQRQCCNGVLFSLIFSLVLTGCGSSGEDSVSTAGTAEGLWTGTTSNGRTVLGAVLDNGTYWFVYSAVNDPSIQSIRGVIQGNSTSSNGSFTSSNGLDFSLDDIERYNITLSGGYVPQQALNGTSRLLTGESVTFNTTPMVTSTDTPDLAKITGSYAVPNIFASIKAPATITISSVGEVGVTGILGQSFSTHMATMCENISGTVSPRANGNVYDFTIAQTITKVGSLCGPLGTQTYRGVAIFDATRNRLYLVALNDDRTKVFFTMSTKQ